MQGYAAHEQGTFEAVTQARANAVTAGATGDPDQIAPAENALSGALRSLFAVAENYPQLRAVESFLQLQETLTATEDKIEYARRYYNTSARDYNIALQTFPRNLIAGPFGFKAVAFFGADEADRAVPQVSFPGSGPGAAGPPSLPAGGPRGFRLPLAPRARRQPAEIRACSASRRVRRTGPRRSSRAQRSAPRSEGGCRRGGGTRRRGAAAGRRCTSPRWRGSCS